MDPADPDAGGDLLRTLITGVCGQDGSYLAELLLARGDEVFGLVRDVTRPGHLGWLPTGVGIVVGDLLDPPSLENALRLVQPDEIYNLAAVTAPGVGWGDVQPPLLVEVTGLGVLRLLEAARTIVPHASFVHASSSAIRDVAHYGPYGAAKRLAHEAVNGYRHAGMAASNAVLYSHTSSRQSDQFLARRIIRHVVDVSRGLPSGLVLRNSTNRRDWGHAPDYMRALPLMAQKPGNWDVATGLTRSVGKFCAIACHEAGVALPAMTPDGAMDYCEPIPKAIWRTNEDLGWRAQDDFEWMVRQMVRQELDKT